MILYAISFMMTQIHWNTLFSVQLIEYTQVIKAYSYYDIVFRRIKKNDVFELFLSFLD